LRHGLSPLAASVRRRLNRPPAERVARCEANNFLPIGRRSDRMTNRVPHRFRRVLFRRLFDIQKKCRNNFFRFQPFEIPQFARIKICKKFGVAHKFARPFRDPSDKKCAQNLRARAFPPSSQAARSISATTSTDLESPTIRRHPPMLKLASAAILTMSESLAASGTI
jgi:hypothetical protein